jgi:methyl-accepting chemotaxis protein
MLGVVIIGFVVTVGFTFLLQQSTSRADVRNTLALDLSDVKNDVQDASDENLLKLARVAAETVPSVMAAQNVNLATLARSLYASEINVIDAQGIIVASSDPSYLGFDMHSGPQASEFLVLLPGGRSSYYVQSYQPITIDSSQWRKYAGVRISGGFIQISYDGEQFVDDIASQVDSRVANRHVGWSGMFVVIEESGKLTGTRFDVSVTSSEVQALFEAAKAHEESTVYEVSFHEMDYYAMRQDVEGFIIIAMLPIVEATSARDLAVLVTSFMEVIVFAALFIAIYVLIKNVVVHSSWEVNGTLDKITSGDLKAEVNVRDSTESSSLSDDINKTVAALRAAIAAFKASFNPMEEFDEGYSSEMRPMNGTMRNGSYRYDGGMSYARGRGRNAKRDSMGRYSSERGYSRDAADMTAELQEMMDDPKYAPVKHDIERLMRKVETM